MAAATSNRNRRTKQGTVREATNAPTHPGHGGLGGRSKGEIERKLLGLANTEAVKEAEIIRDDDHTLYLPFTLDAETLASEYPTVDKTLAPLDAALDKLLKVHPQFDAAVRELEKM